MKTRCFKIVSNRTGVCPSTRQITVYCVDMCWLRYRPPWSSALIQQNTITENGSPENCADDKSVRVVANKLRQVNRDGAMAKLDLVTRCKMCRNRQILSSARLKLGEYAIRPF